MPSPTAYVMSSATTECVLSFFIRLVRCLSTVWLLNTVIEILYQTMTIICVFDNSAGMSSEILTSIEGKGSCCFL